MCVPSPGIADIAQSREHKLVLCVPDAHVCVPGTCNVFWLGNLRPKTAFPGCTGSSSNRNCDVSAGSWWGREAPTPAIGAPQADYEGVRVGVILDPRSGP